MRLVIWLLLAAVIAAEVAEEPWVEEEDVDESYDDQEELSYRRKRDVYYEEPYEYVRVKRCDEEPAYRVRRSAEYTRVPRQVHQYEVHEFNDESIPSSPPYEEMLAASAEHYHRVYAAPGAPSAAYYQNPDVSAGRYPVPSHAQYVAAPINVQAAYSHNPHNSASPVQVPHAQYPAAPIKVQAAHNPHTPVQVHPSPVRFPSPVSVANHSPVQFVSPTHVNAHHVNVAPTHTVNAAYPPTKFLPVNVAVPPSISPAAAAEASILGPAPVPSAAISHPPQQLSEGDLFEAANALHHQKHHKHSHGHAQGGGHKHHAHHHAGRGGKTVKGFNQDHHVDKGGKGFKIDEHHRKEYEEAQGKKKKHRDEAGHKGNHEEEAHGHRGAKFDEKKGHKKGHKTKGYHNKYHKDEFHKEHKFYDDFHKSGEHHRYGKFHAKHASNESGKKKAHHVNAGHDFVEKGKKGYSNKGHMDADHKGHKGKSGHEEHHEHHSSHGKKGGKEGGSEWGYAKKN